MGARDIPIKRVEQIEQIQIDLGDIPEDPEHQVRLREIAAERSRAWVESMRAKDSMTDRAMHKIGQMVLPHWDRGDRNEPLPQ